MQPIIVWFRNDLRLADNPALAAAAKTGAPLIPVFVLENGVGREPGAASKWWLHHALASLDADLTERYGLRLVLRRGEPSEVLRHLVEETNARGVYWNRRYSQAGIAADKTIKSALKADGTDAESFNGHLLYEPWQIENKSGEPFRVFSAFWRTARQISFTAPTPAPKTIPEHGQTLSSEDLDALGLAPTSPNWAAEWPDLWTPGEDGAVRQLDHFIDTALLHYAQDRDRPDLEHTSRLSPYLAWGNISVRSVAARIESLEGDAPTKAREKFLSELGWREFSYHLLYHFPHLPTDNFVQTFDDFPWREDADSLGAWQRGESGYPIVDAGMRELWQTGWMHNRVRMVVASFLTKHLLIHWREGEAWFWDTLVDADPANNSASWQWVAGSGADAAPYFRMFNPTLQGEKFDPNGDYVRTYVPEIANLPNGVIHKPWAADSKTLDEAGIQLGKTYPRPIVEHARARERALDAFQTIKSKAA